MNANATREIMWNIPASFKYAMYGLLLVATLAMFKGFYEKYKFVTQGKSIKGLLPSQLNWKAFFETIFFTGKVSLRSLLYFKGSHARSHLLINTSEHRKVFHKYGGGVYEDLLIFNRHVSGIFGSWERFCLRNKMLIFSNFSQYFCWHQGTFFFLLTGSVVSCVIKKRQGSMSVK